MVVFNEIWFDDLQMKLPKSVFSHVQAEWTAAWKWLGLFRISDTVSSTTYLDEHRLSPLLSSQLLEVSPYPYTQGTPPTTCTKVAPNQPKWTVPTAPHHQQRNKWLMQRAQQHCPMMEREAECAVSARVQKKHTSTATSPSTHWWFGIILNFHI